jgi:hypothetical protein
MAADRGLQLKKIDEEVGCLFGVKTPRQLMIGRMPKRV